MLHRSTLVLTLLLLLFSLLSCRQQSKSESAERALSDFLTFLNQGRYAQAAALYGGTYDVLAGWNPDVDRGDHATLLERGCTVNGLQCLPVASIVARQDSDPGSFRFDVTFVNPDGGPFELAPQDALASGRNPVTSFAYTVVESEAGFDVLELPVYVP